MQKKNLGVHRPGRAKTVFRKETKETYEAGWLRRKQQRRFTSVFDQPASCGSCEDRAAIVGDQKLESTTTKAINTNSIGYRIEDLRNEGCRTQKRVEGTRL